MGASKKPLHRAGAIPYYTENDQLYFLFMLPSNPKYGGSDFQIAKGKCEDGEAAIETAKREAQEELGLDPLNIVDAQELGVFLGRTTIFLFNVQNPHQLATPCFETAEVKWMTPDEFLVSGRDIHKSIVRKAIAFLKDNNANN